MLIGCWCDVGRRDLRSASAKCYEDRWREAIGRFSYEWKQLLSLLGAVHLWWICLLAMPFFIGNLEANRTSWTRRDPSGRPRAAGARTRRRVERGVELAGV
jgi:hypothetical protein